jgi:hypothetical protein
MYNKMVIPKGMPIARHVPRPEIEVPPGELPLIPKDAPPEKSVQELWKAQVRTFDLSDEEQRLAYEAVWQRVTDGLAKVSPDHRIDFHNGKYIAYLRWADFSYKLPT